MIERLNREDGLAVTARRAEREPRDAHRPPGVPHRDRPHRGIRFGRGTECGRLHPQGLPGFLTGASHGTLPPTTRRRPQFGQRLCADRARPRDHLPGHRGTSTSRRARWPCSPPTSCTRWASGVCRSAIALIVGLGVGFAIGAAAEVGLVRPISKKSPFAVFIVTIGLFQLLNWLSGAIWGDQVLPNSGVGSKQQQYPSLFPDQPDDFVKIFGAAIRYQSLGVLVLTLVITGLLFLLFNKTKFGLAMRAVDQQRRERQTRRHPGQHRADGELGPRRGDRRPRRCRVRRYQQQRQPRPDVHRVHLRVGSRHPRRVRLARWCRDRRSGDRRDRDDGPPATSASSARR